MSLKPTSVPKQSRPKTVARLDRPLPAGTTNRKNTSQESLPPKPIHKPGHIPDYLRKGRKQIDSAAGVHPNVWQEKCHTLEEKIAWHRTESDAQQQLIASLQERVAQLDAFMQAIPTEVTRLCSEIEERERKIQNLERSAADEFSAKLDLLREEVREVKRLVQQPAEVFQYYERQLNGTVDLMARSYRQLLTMVETDHRSRCTGREDSGKEEQEVDRDLYRQKMRLDKRNRHTQIRVKKYDG